MDLRASLEGRLSDYMTAAYVTVSPGDSVSGAAKSMQARGATEAVVVMDSSPIGILTERDILYKVVAADLDPRKLAVRDVMSAPIETIDGSSKVGDAIKKMTGLGVRRLCVTEGGKIIGLVTQKSLVGGEVHRSVPLPELVNPDALSCPYCDATMKDGKELSKHIDQVHLGLGLLEGNRSKW